MKTTFSILLLVTTAAFAAHKVEEHIVAPPWVNGTLLTMSPKGMHVACVNPQDAKWVVSIDGVASQPYDEVVQAAATIKITYMPSGEILGVDVVDKGPVAFSPDGKRYAYAARNGDEVFLILDGKESFRARQSLSAPPVQLMQFTPDGGHLYFYNPSGDTFQSFRLMMDGKPVTPAFDGTPPLLFNEDGSHWLLHAPKAKQPTAEKMIIVDGKVMEYTGAMPRLTPDGKSVLCISKVGTEQRLLKDGKSILTRDGEFIDSYKISANGDIYAIVRHGVGEKDLYRNGKRVENASGTFEVFLSPDGKRWAAHGQSGLGKAYWVVLDGKKGPDFKTVSGITFSPDSTVCLYRGERDDGWHLVTNGEMDPQGYGLLQAMFAPKGHEIILSAGSQPMDQSVVHKGKASPKCRNVFQLAVSPGGERVAYFVPNASANTDLIVDGEMKGFGHSMVNPPVFSPDAKHYAAAARSVDGGGNTLLVDDHFSPEMLNFQSPCEFTPDSQHLIISGVFVDENKVKQNCYFLDGQPVAPRGNRALKWVNSPRMGKQVRPPAFHQVDFSEPEQELRDWEYQDDGSIIFVGVESTGTGPGAFKRVKVTPDPEITFVTGLAAAESAYLQTIADAEAAKKKAAEEAQAAKLKAQEEAAAAAAKRKADYDAAVAAKQKARQDAIKLKTLNIQRAKQGLPPLKELPPE